MKNWQKKVQNYVCFTWNCNDSEKVQNQFGIKFYIMWWIYFKIWPTLTKIPQNINFPHFHFFLLQILPSANKCLQILRPTLFSLWNRTTWTPSEDEYPSPFAGSLHKSAVVPSRGGGVLTSGNLRRSLVIKQLFSTEHLFFSSDKCDPFYFLLSIGTIWDDQWKTC